MKIKRISIMMLMFLLVFSSVAYAGEEGSSNPAISAMSGMSGDSALADPTGKLGEIINSVIGLIQISGTGISLIMVTALGIKYMMAAPSDKADVKKQITPMVIGCAILFASVNIVQIIANFASEL